ncbi:hypothetical protein CNR22_23675 [Sphingobacteriaceae bacterium]|nr:hypothetical protein CNR22_23675 [Sphingobacteriaceae bacterium]
MYVLEKLLLTSFEKQQVVRLWNKEYPKSLNFADDQGFDQYLKTLSNPQHYLLTSESKEILGWASKFSREGTTWFAIILDDKIQGKGYGSKILTAIQKNETALHAWVIDKDNALKANGTFYKSPLDFYLKQKFEVHSQIRLETEKLSAVKIVWSS